MAPVADLRSRVRQCIRVVEKTTPEIARELNADLKQVRLCTAALAGLGDVTFGASRDFEPCVRLTSQGRERLAEGRA